MPLDLDGGTLYHVLNGEEALTEALAVGVRPGDLDGNAGKALTFIVGHRKDHGVLPKREDVESLFGSGLIQQTGLARAYVFAELKRRSLFRSVALGVDSVDKALKKNDPEGAFLALLQAVDESKKEKPKHKPPTNLFSLGQAVLDEYDLIESGVLGIPTPWESINAMTMGWWPGTNSWLLARPGVGKTMLAVIAARHAWKLRFSEDMPKKINTLITSPEMNKLQLAERFFSIDSKIAYGDIVGATLGNFGKQKYETHVHSLAKEEGIWVLDATDDLTPSHIEEAIDEVKADFVVIDAAYKIKWKQKADRFENMYEGVDLISNWAKREWQGGKKISMLADSQLNRRGGKKGGLVQESVALADNLNWEGDNIFFVEQTEDMKADKWCRLIAGKIRRMAEWKSSVAINWDMTEMDFSEQVADEDEEFKDEGYEEVPEGTEFEDDQIPF